MEARNRIKEYFDSLPVEAFSRKELLEEEVVALVQRLVRSETGRRPVVVSALSVL